jgi:hydroxymethylglutaryl-CoA synthase
MENKRVGIDALGVAFPLHFLPLADLALARGVEPAKYEKGLGCTAMAIPHPSEDTVTLAASAGLAALKNNGIDPAEIGLLIVGTETAVDHAKPVASYVQGLLGIPGDCRVLEIKHACYGGTAGVLNACEWLASGAARGRKALVIASDVARYPLRSPGEPTQGAGAAAMVVAESPRLLEVDFCSTGVWSRDVHDFWRPLSSPDALVDGALSLACYLEGLEKAYAGYLARGGRDEAELSALLFHTPFVKMAQKGHQALLTMTGHDEAAIAGSYAQRVQPSLTAAARIGNAYSASLWVGLAAAVTSGLHGADAKVGFYSYGSGFCAEYFTGSLVKGGAARVAGIETLALRQAIDVATYEQWRDERLQGAKREVPEGAFSPFYYAGDVDGQRVYASVAEAQAAGV